MHFLRSEFLPSINAYQRLREVARQLGDRAKEAEALYQISSGYHRAHEIEHALDYAEQAKALALEIDAKNILAGSLFVMASVYRVPANQTRPPATTRKPYASAVRPGTKRLKASPSSSSEHSTTGRGTSRRSGCSSRVPASVTRTTCSTSCCGASFVLAWPVVGGGSMRRRCGRCKGLELKCTARR